MRVSCIRIGTDLLIGKRNDTIVNYLAKNFLGIGGVLTDVITIQNNPDSIFHSLKFINNNTIFIVGENSSVKNFGIKKAIADNYGLTLKEDSEVKEHVNEYYKSKNTPVLIESENEYHLPTNSTPIISDKSVFKGFVLNHEGKTIIFVPDDLNFVSDVFEGSIAPIIRDSIQINYKTITLKTFGISEKDIYSILQEEIKNIYKILFITYPSELEVTILIRYNENLSDEIIRSFTAKVYEKLNKYIYADEDVTLQYRANELLKLTKKKISLAESVTGGEITSTLIKASENIRDIIDQSIICPTIDSKVKYLQASKNVLERYGEVSIEAVYEMAAGLLETTKSDFVICNVGDIDGNDNGAKKTAFIAVGDSDGIHVYKNSFIGNKETIINNITQTSLFYLIKNIRQKDLIFTEIVV